MGLIPYAGVGARSTPPQVCARMTAVARRLRALGYLLRSGDAVGADRAFAAGAGSIGGTATAIRIAELHGIPVFNLYDPAALDRLALIVRQNATAR